ncbi:endonuclease/exonuclease/phosphatase family protein [Alisedimentitalea sp. MJ-SS2]|uniref:endonuclease/exonuclease/phosphatase family protein n=1 Tax=Aliisedimentitalea sp. MJ-SS2 TaxID=3049795 RepID=UPI0029150A60|nr:endonuclease/exonuclease/phosphatase family protein [Alisedimentitalea sp. MJ-SS2]MDU8928113.1 endonuclease/exonuclease/phosphatase family protein [Alisedimentitalea sp. MJ-SS2]
MRIATLNVQNLRLRGSHLDGARDGDVPGDTGPGARAIDWIDRRLTAALIRDADADLIVLQEVFDADTLEHFHNHYLAPLGVTYPIRHCLPGNDGRGLDIALLSRLPVTRITSHATLTAGDTGVDPALGLDPDLPIFRRDCLQIDLPDLALYACHFKAPYPDADVAWATRRAEAQSVRHLIESHFPNPSIARWLILGDLNDPVDAPTGRNRAIAPLLPPFSESLVDRLPPDRRWSYHQPRDHFYAAPDKLLASPALAADNPDALPRILRHGMGFESTRYTGLRLPGTGEHRPHASDHALIHVDLD